MLWWLKHLIWSPCLVFLGSTVSINEKWSKAGSVVYRATLHAWTDTLLGSPTKIPLYHACINMDIKNRKQHQQPHRRTPGTIQPCYPQHKDLCIQTFHGVCWVMEVCHSRYGGTKTLANLTHTHSYTLLFTHLYTHRQKRAVWGRWQTIRLSHPGCS